MTDDIERLAALFERFPGIGPRQARRFVYFLLRADREYKKELLDRIATLSIGISRCSSCLRYIPKGETICSVCKNSARDGQLMIVAKDADIDSIEKTGIYSGKYFVLGSLVPLTDPVPTAAYMSQIIARILNDSTLNEVIFALPVTTDGEHTKDTVSEALKKALDDLKVSNSIQFRTLGRGLSTGSELEYADVETIKSAFHHRT
jgi:recombination protein RecR